MTIPAPFWPMAKYKQFIRYKLEPQQNGKTLKRPISPHTGYVCSVTDESNLSDYQTAAASKFGDGIRFVFTKADPFYFVDLDNCLEGSKWSDTAFEVIKLCGDSAVEVSQSGKGLHIFGTGTLPEHKCKNTKLGLELYTHNRFVALTFDRAIGYAGSENGDLSTLIGRYFSDRNDSPPSIIGSTTN